jgi:hypothetical protein
LLNQPTSPSNSFLIAKERLAIKLRY